MIKIEKVNSIVTEFERVQKYSEVLVDQVFPELRVAVSKGRDTKDELFMEKAKDTLRELKSSVTSLEGLLEDGNGDSYEESNSDGINSVGSV